MHAYVCVYVYTHTYSSSSLVTGQTSILKAMPRRAQKTLIFVKDNDNDGVEGKCLVWCP